MSELEVMTSRKDNWAMSCLILTICLFVSVCINFSQADYYKKDIRFAESICNDKNSIIIQKLVIEKEMLEGAINNVYMYNIKSYPETMQKMIIAARNKNKIDFDFYIRQMKEENLQSIKK